jgi:membrane fusion protein (multidrug efflux system)
MSKSTIKIIFSVITFAITAIVLLKITSRTELNSDKNGDNPRSRVVPVDVTVINPKPLEITVQTVGTILSNEEVDLKSEISGKIVKINFKEGTFVKKGSLLIKINDADLQALLKKTELKKNLAEDKEFRQRKLLEINGTSQEYYDAALNELNSLKAEIEEIKVRIDKTEIVAPFDGVIGLRFISEGSYITPTTKIAAIQNNNPVKIDFSISQKYSNQIAVRDKIKFKIPTSGKIFSADVYAIEPRIDESTRTLKVRAVLNNFNNELIPGSFVEVELNLENLKNAITIPTQSVVPDISGEKVFLYRSGQAIQIKIETGLRTEEEIQILNGLQEGDTVITSGILQLKPKTKVKITSIN